MKKIMLLLVALVAMTSTVYGQGTKLSSFPVVTTDTNISLVCVSDSGGAYKDKLFPQGLLVTYMVDILSGIGTLDYVLGNGNVTGKSAVFSNGGANVVTINPLGNGISMAMSGYNTYYGADIAVLTTAGNAQVSQIVPGYIDVHNLSNHAITLDTAIYLTDAGSNQAIGFNVISNVGFFSWKDAVSNLSMTQHLAHLTSAQNWWWRNRSDTVAGLGDVDSVAHACDSVALHYADSVAGGGTLQTVTTAGPTTTNSMYIEGTTPVFSVYNPLTSAQTDLNYQSLKVQGTSGPGHQLFVYDSAICFIQGGTGALMTHSITAGTQWYLPDSSGIIALLSDIPAPHAAGTPSGAYGTGAGTSPGTMTITGSDIGGMITVVTGTSPASGAVIITISYSNSFSAINSVVLTPANENAAALYGPATVFVQAISIFGFTLYTSAPLTGSTTYSWYYHTDGN